MRIGKSKFMALLLSALLVTGTFAGPVFASEIEIPDNTFEYLTNSEEEAGKGATEEDPALIEEGNNEDSPQQTEEAEDEATVPSDEDEITNEDTETSDNMEGETFSLSAPETDDALPLEMEEDENGIPSDAEEISAEAADRPKDAEDDVFSSHSSEPKTDGGAASETEEDTEESADAFADQASEYSYSDEVDGAESIEEEDRNTEKTTKVDEEISSKEAGKNTIENIEDNDVMNDSKEEDVLDTDNVSGNQIINNDQIVEYVDSEALNNIVDSGTCGLNLNWTLGDDGTLTISGTGNMFSYGYYEDLAPWSSQENSTEVKNVIFDGSITSIGDCAFYGCAGLSTVTIPSEVKYIGEKAFSTCYGLKNVNILEGVETICEEAFSDCTALESVTLPDSMCYISRFAFYRCTALQSIIIPEGIISIGQGAFLGCSNLENVVIPESITDIEDDAFSKTKWLEAFGDFVILNGVLLKYQGSDSDVIIPEDVTAIGEGAFSSNEQIENVVIPPSVTEIRTGAFSSCYNLNSVTIPPTVSGIPASAFYHCQSLSSITIPDGVSVIGGDAFYQCDSLTSVIIPSSVTVIYEEAFSHCNGLTNVVLKEGLIDIGERAFFCCGNLESVVIPSSVTNLGWQAFNNCYNLADVTLPSVFMSQISNCFNGTAWLDSFGDFVIVDNILLKYQGESENVVIPLGVTSISRLAFFNNSRVKNVTMPASVTSIASEAFEWCYNLEKITISDNLTSIGDMAFNNCSKLKSLVIPSGVKSIGKYAFEYCYKLSKVTILSVGTSFGEHVFDQHNYDEYPPVILYCYPGSTTEQYAKDNGIEYKYIEVEKTSIEEASIGAISNTTYTGKRIMPTPVVKLESSTLIPDVDYKLTYSDNLYAGTATIIITGKGNYSGTKKVTFKINKADQIITAKTTASSIAVGKTATVSLSGAKGSKSFKSSDKTIAIVDASTGKVTAKKVGKVTITATSGSTSNFNKASKSVKINVVPAATSSISTANLATGIKLTWKKVTGATGYLVYRGNTKIATIKSGSTVTYTDTKTNTNGTKYTFKIIPTASTGNGAAKSLTTYRVARPAISSVNNTAAGKITVKWGKNAKGTGYQIHYCTDKTFNTGNKSANINSASTVSKVIGSLTKGKTYYVRIRTYKTVGSTKYFSGWSTVKSIKISK